MKTLSTFLTSLLIASWISVAAVVSVQNFTPVSLKFFTLESVEVPIGLVLAFSAGLGAVATAIAQALFSAPSSPKRFED